MKYFSILFLVSGLIALCSLINYAAHHTMPIRSLTVNVLPLERHITTEYVR